MATLTSNNQQGTASRRGKHLKPGESSVGEDRRAQIVAFAERYIREHGYAPSHKTIRDALFISKGNLFFHMRKLREDGRIIGPGDGAHAWTLPKFAAACKAVE